MAALPAGLTAGTWNIDPSHSEFAFRVRYAGVSRVRGSFDVIGGSFTVGESLEELSVSAHADTASVDTGNADRDAHLQQADFFLAEEHPRLTFASTSAVLGADGEFTLVGDLTIRGVTKSVEFAASFNGAAEDPYGQTIAGFDASAKVDRRDFGIAFDAAMPGGDLLVGNRVDILIELEAVKA